MNASKSLGVSTSLFFALAIAASSEDAAAVQTEKDQDMTSQPQAFLQSLVGSWEGTCRTWFRPGELADESMVKGELHLVLGGRFLRHT
jgi:hypothetical protein